MCLFAGILSIKTEASAPFNIPVGTDKSNSQGKYDVNRPGVFNMSDAAVICPTMCSADEKTDTPTGDKSFERHSIKAPQRAHKPPLAESIIDTGVPNKMPVRAILKAKTTMLSVFPIRYRQNSTQIFARPSLKPGSGKGKRARRGRSRVESTAERTARIAHVQSRLTLSDNSVHLLTGRTSAN